MNKKCETNHCLHILNTISIPGTFSSRRGYSKVGKSTVKGIEWVLQEKRNRQIRTLVSITFGCGEKVINGYKTAQGTERCMVITDRECPLSAKRKVAPKELSINV